MLRLFFLIAADHDSIHLRNYTAKNLDDISHVPPTPSINIHVLWDEI